MKKDNSDICIKISEDVIAKIAQMAALEVGGISIKSRKAVQITNLGGAVGINISVVAASGEDASYLAKKIQASIKDNVQSMTGIPVPRVCVRITGISDYD